MEPYNYPMTKPEFTSVCTASQIGREMFDSGSFLLVYLFLIRIFVSRAHPWSSCETAKIAFVLVQLP